MFNYIRDNLIQIKDEISKIAEKSGRQRDEITLIAVSKTFPADVIPEAIKAGQTLFAENRVQEGEEKRTILEGVDFQYHLIGHLQSNKVNKAIRYFDMIHSIDSLELAKKIHDSCIREGKKMPILLQVNTSAEAQKSGLPYNIDDIIELVRQIQNMKALDLQGFMTIGPLSIDEKATRKCFTMLRELKEKVNIALSLNLKHLSMGMSHDFQWAIEEGSTMIRIGNSIFGKRPYQL